MKRAFDANVSKARPRTKVTTLVAERDEAPLSKELAKALVAPRAKKVAEAAGASAAEVSRRPREETRVDELAQREETLAAQAGEVAHAAHREERGSHREQLAQAMRLAAARMAEAEAAVKLRREAAQVPSWVARAAVPEAPELADELVDAAALVESDEPIDGAYAAAATAELVREASMGEKQRGASASPAQARLFADAREPKPPARARLSAPGEETVSQGRARIAELRQRLSSSQPRLHTDDVAPASAAAAVRRAVEELRARLATALEEREGLSRALEEARDQLARAHAELAARGRKLESAEALAEERARLAEELAAEAEALAEERDQALARILELKSLDEQQGGLLAEVEQALASRDAALAAARAELAELGAALDARAAEAEELSARLGERTRERDRLAARVEELEAEVRGLGATREALAELQRLVGSAAR